MLNTFNVNYNQNTRQRNFLGDLTTTVYNVAVNAVGGNAYPLGGEPVSFLAEFRETYTVIANLAFQPAGAGAADPIGAMAVGFEADGVNTGRLRFYQSGAPNANFAELAVGAYVNSFSFQLTVHGRPSTDAS